MEGLRKKCFLLMVFMATMLLADCRKPVLHRVGGGKYSWAPNFNFSEWASHEEFYVGDWLYFGFDKQRYNVLEVNKTGYDKCIDTNFVMNITRGGRDVFNLTEPKPYYFISGGGYCFKGMKLAITAKDSPPASPIVIASGSPTATCCIQITLLTMFALTLASKILFNKFI
ncbi:lamin-like protein [Tripterygium wilfordii]|uniref:Lamin-like protein n=1 Tax=Tripterygium wilfordii TaxID=458696 RepID=A0A7J7DF69_TRIWF|nr:lamin-like protein [Tripterygium wilfordii]KAF5744972.1 lamin-like protein [Tripterygium wilfordii]